MSQDDKHSGGATAFPASQDLRPGAPREIGSEELLGNSRSVRIRHGGEVYTLQRTSNGKLILTK